jgi:hypothetical protein
MSSFFNPRGLHNVDFRNLAFEIIENLGLLNDSNDAIDLSDNDIVSLDNFLLFRRLSVLIVHNSRIATCVGLLSLIRRFLLQRIPPLKF